MLLLLFTFSFWHSLWQYSHSSDSSVYMKQKWYINKFTNKHMWYYYDFTLNSNKKRNFRILPSKLSSRCLAWYSRKFRQRSREGIGRTKKTFGRRWFHWTFRRFNFTTFLRARKFDVQLAKEMFENCEKWRKDYGTDTILQDFHYDEKPLIAKFYPQYYHKTDKDGRPVYFEELGAVNLHEMNKVTSEEDVEKLGLGIRICRSIQITCLFKSCWSPSGNFMYNYGFERYLHI